MDYPQCVVYKYEIVDSTAPSDQSPHTQYPSANVDSSVTTCSDIIPLSPTTAESTEIAKCDQIGVISQVPMSWNIKLKVHYR